MGVGFGGICMKIPTAIQAPSKLYYFVLYAPHRLYYHMKTWAPSPLALPLNERGGQRDVGVIFSLPWYLRRSGTLNITLILVVHQSIRAHAPTQLSRETRAGPLLGCHFSKERRLAKEATNPFLARITTI